MPEMSSSNTPAQVEWGLVALLPLVPLSTLGTWAGVPVNRPTWSEVQKGRTPIIRGWDSGRFAGYFYVKALALTAPVALAA